MSDLLKAIQPQLQPLTNTDNPPVLYSKFSVENKTSRARIQWGKCTVSFPQGSVINEQELLKYNLDNKTAHWKIIKWFYRNGIKDSIALAQLKAPVFMSPNTQVFVNIYKYDEPITSSIRFDFASNILDWISDPNFLSSLSFRANFQNDNNIYNAYPLDNIELYETNSSELILRSRSHFFYINPVTFQKTFHPLSLTTYFTIDALSPMVKVTYVLGNDTVEMPVNNGIRINYIQIISNSVLVEQQILKPQAYGSFNNLFLADGQTISLRTVVYVKSKTLDNNGILHETYLAELQDPMICTLDYNKHKENRALGPCQSIIDLRFDPSNYQSFKNSLENTFGSMYNAQKPTDYLDLINQAPFITGAQPDFAATVPQSLVMALQINSQKFLTKYLLAVDRECMRPSFYWKNNQRIKASMYPNLFFWSGRPHFDYSWNNSYPDWASRGAENYNPGDFQGWSGQDNQHMSNNYLRCMYELTADPYLGDICKYYQDVTYFNYFTRWFNEVEAERASRSMKEALLLSVLNSNTETSQTLINKVKDKMKNVYKTQCEQIMQQFPAHIPTVAPLDACDQRVFEAQYCPPQGQNQLIVASSWHSGFHMEFLNLMIEMGFEKDSAMQLAQYYQTAINNYFDSNGYPYTLVYLPNPSIFEQGGIGVYWWAGWLNISQHFPPNDRINLLRNTIRSSILSIVDPNILQYYTDLDNWYSF